MIFKNTVRGGLVLASLAGGCADHHLASDARAMLDGGAFDTGTLLDAARDSRTPRDASGPDASTRDSSIGDTRPDTARRDSGTTLEAAIRAVCTKVNLCFPAEVPDVEECVAEGLEYIPTYSPACVEAIAAYIECIYMPECSVLLDDVMWETHVETNCMEEAALFEAVCPEG